MDARPRAGRATPGADRRLHRRPADQGRDPGRGGRTGRRDARGRRAPRPSPIPDATVDLVGTGGDHGPARHGVQRLDDGLARAAAAGRDRLQARQPQGVVDIGSTDLLEALGVEVELDGPRVVACVAETGVGFAFARMFHPAMRHAAPVRAELGIPTVFNVLGPLSHPGRVGARFSGCRTRDCSTWYRRAALRGASTRAMVVHGSDGLDELTVTEDRPWSRSRGGATRRFEVRPEDVGLAATMRDIGVGDPRGERRGGDARSSRAAGSRRATWCVLNAAAGLVVADVVDGPRRRRRSRGGGDRLRRGGRGRWASSSPSAGHCCRQRRRLRSGPIPRLRRPGDACGPVAGLEPGDHGQDRRQRAVDLDQAEPSRVAIEPGRDAHDLVGELTGTGAPGSGGSSGCISTGRGGSSTGPTKPAIGRVSGGHRTDAPVVVSVTVRRRPHVPQHAPSELGALPESTGDHEALAVDAAGGTVVGVEVALVRATSRSRAAAASSKRSAAASASMRSRSGSSRSVGPVGEAARPRGRRRGAYAAGSTAPAHGHSATPSWAGVHGRSRAAGPAGRGRCSAAAARPTRWPRPPRWPRPVDGSGPR